ncbi:dual specificity protein phosphatase 26-like isoform X2 [Cyprinus carpio]|uniref:Dual specificity protein phosphatase 26 n=1 Tax=Cyprinus carpio TaxID=7962 RepID=A0A9Q9V4Y6_CYPCA|nr:dual specificity protein phosphatase 26-like isoform X2 [Cyprinus carpio]
MTLTDACGDCVVHLNQSKQVPGVSFNKKQWTLNAHLQLKMSYRSKYCPGTSRSAAPVVDFTSPGVAVMEAERLLVSGRAVNTNADEVWPSLYIGNISRRGGEIYDGMGITYMGIDAHDSPTYDMSANFNKAAEFIHTALKRGGKILVHCHVGVSRSATIVLAYLMLKQNMTLVEAIQKVKEGRGVFPNRGFLRQLIDLHIKLYGYRN